MSSHIFYALIQVAKYVINIYASCKLTKWTGLFPCRLTWEIWSLDSSNIQRRESTRGQGVRFLAPSCRSVLFGRLICRLRVNKSNWTTETVFGYLSTLKHDRQCLKDALITSFYFCLYLVFSKLFFFLFFLFYGIANCIFH